jgi:hypothetical protein
MFNKLVTLFALTFRYLQNSSYRDLTRIAPVRRIKLFIRELIYRPQLALYREAVVFNFHCAWTAKSAPPSTLHFVGAGIPSLHPRLRYAAPGRSLPRLKRGRDSFLAKGPGPCPVLASGNTTSPYCRAVMRHT